MGAALRLKGFLVLVAVAGLAAPSAFGAWADYAPRTFENGAYLDLLASWEKDDTNAEARSFGWSDTFFKERITLFSSGYFYHPRFLQYYLSVGGALKQENYQTTYLDTQGWKSGTGFEYDARLFFLPEHPYNLELYARRFEPLYKDQSASQHDSVETTWGANFRYRRKPYFFNARYGEDRLESGPTWSTVDRLNLDGEYFKRYNNGNILSFNAAFNPSHFTDSSGLTGDSSEYLLGNVVELGRARLFSNVNSFDLSQEDPLSGTYTNKQLSWYELLSGTFPCELRADLSYRYLDNTSANEDRPRGSDTELSSTSRQVQLDLSQRLYQSLDTVYRGMRDSRVSSGGDTTNVSQWLAFNYTKAIPRGRVMAGVNGGRSETENEGRADIVDEPHLAQAVPGTFRLGQQNAEAATLDVYLKSPLSPYEPVLLKEGVHYILNPVAGTYDVTILGLPPRFAVPGTYDFYVSYTLTSGQFKLRSDVFGYNASVELLDHLLTPYFSYSTINSEVLSGEFPGTPIDSTTYTAGMNFLRGPWRAVGEYQRFEWDVSPYRAWRLQGQYVGPVNATTNVYATASYLDKYYPEGTSEDLTEAYTDRTTSLSGTVQKQLPPRGMMASLGGTWSHLDGLVTNDAYALNATLTWKVGKLDFSAGASAYHSDTESVNGPSYGRTHQYYFFKIRRQLF